MQFKVLVSFFFAYMAAVQAAPVEVPKLPTDAVGIVNLDVPINVPVTIGTRLLSDIIASLPQDVAATVTSILGDLPVTATIEEVKNALPTTILSLLPADVLTILNGTPGGIVATVKGVVDSAIPLDIEAIAPAVVKRLVDLPAKDAASAIVDGAGYAVHRISGSVIDNLDGRQLGDEVPAISSTEGLFSSLKTPELPAIPTLPLKIRQVDLPDIDALKVDGITNAITTPKVVRRYLRRSVDDVNVPAVPAVKDVEVPSVPSLPIH